MELMTLYFQVSLLNPLLKTQAKDYLPPLAKQCGIYLYSSILKSYHFLFHSMKFYNVCVKGGSVSAPLTRMIFITDNVDKEAEHLSPVV